MLNDPQHEYTYFYKALFSYIAAQVIFTWIGRSLILRRVRRQLENGVVRFNTLLAGNNSVAYQTYKDTKAGLGTAGYHYTGFIAARQETNGISTHLPQYGSFDDLEKVIQEHRIVQHGVPVTRRKPETAGSVRHAEDFHERSDDQRHRRNDHREPGDDARAR